MILILLSNRASIRMLAGIFKGTPDGWKVGEVKEGITFH